MSLEKNNELSNRIKPLKKSGEDSSRYTIEGKEKKNVSMGEDDFKTMENKASVLNQNLKKLHIRSWFSVAARSC